MVFTKHKKFSTHLKLNGKKIESVSEMKIVGTIITDDLKWSKNTKFLVKRAYARMELLRQVKNFTKSTKDRIQIYKTYIRSVVEQSCVVWNYNITKKNEMELERVQKVAIRLISDSKESYKNVLKELNLETLKERRNKLSEKFAEKCVKSDKNKLMFEIKKKNTQYEVEKY